VTGEGCTLRDIRLVNDIIIENRPQVVSEELFRSSNYTSVSKNNGVDKSSSKYFEMSLKGNREAVICAGLESWEKRLHITRTTDFEKILLID
jgi:hypothetical protein